MRIEPIHYGSTFGILAWFLPGYDTPTAARHDTQAPGIIDVATCLTQLRSTFRGQLLKEAATLFATACSIALEPGRRGRP